jgi:hypothetical protein
MNIKELKVLVDTAINLGYSDAQLVLNDSRDGNESYPIAIAELKKGGTQHDPSVMLVVSYDNR